MKVVRSFLVLVSLFLGATSCLGGAVLIAGAHENPLAIVQQGLPANSPFRSLIVPGLFLFGGVGLFDIWTLWVNLREQRNSGLWSAFEGVLLICWGSSWQTPLWLRYASCALALILLASGLGLQINGLMRNRTTEEGPH